LVKVINSASETLAILKNIWNTIKTEALNREYTFDFSTVIDGDKSQYITTTNKIEVENDWFNIIYFKKNRSIDGITFDVSCEHASYDLISANFTAGFTATGVFSAMATTVLSGTGFTIGTVEITASQTISINEATNGRNIMFQLATLYGGELKFDKYAISLLTRRGADNGVQFRYRKNISAASVIVDNRKKVGGLPTISYEVDVAELEFEHGYISKGYSSLEHYELGDTIRVIDEDLDIDISLRIVKESHDPEQRMQGTVEISNFVDDLTDTLMQIQTTSVAKNAIYNGVSIGPDEGFVAERSDELVKTSTNATNGIQIDLRDSITASYTAVFYVQVDTATGTAKLYLAGNAVFSGQVIASDFIGGTIIIGSGSNTFNANGTDGIWLGATALATAPFSSTLSGAVTADNLLLTGGVIQVGTSNDTFRFTESDGLWLGNTTFGSAPFRVTMSGSATANDLTLTGGLFNIGTGTNTLQFNTTNGLFLGSTAAASAPFKASMSGSVTATDITMTGNSTITGGIITGGTIRTAATGERIELTAGRLASYNSSNQLHGIVTQTAGATWGDLRFYDTDIETFRIENALTGTGYTLKGMNGGAAIYLDPFFSGDAQFMSGSNIGFFGTNPVSKDSVANQSATTAVETVLAKLNELIDALQSYGLV